VTIPSRDARLPRGQGAARRELFPFQYRDRARGSGSVRAATRVRL